MFDNLVKSPKVRHSGLAVIPDYDPGRNDGKKNISPFYEAIMFCT